jgi:hypothetical protein
LIASRVERWREFVHAVSVAGGSHIDPLAAPEQVWTLYVADLTRRGLKKPTISQHLSAIRSWHADNAARVPFQTGQARRALRGAERNPLHAPQQPPRPERLPITTAVLMQIRPHVDTNSWSGALLWLACLFGTLGLLRAGEFTTDSDLPPLERDRRMLRLRHLSLAADGASMVLHVPVTKTAQVDGVRVTYSAARAGAESAAPAAAVNSLPLCPVAAWRAYAAVRVTQAPASIRDDAPLLMAHDGMPLSKRSLVEQLRTVLRAAGVADDATLRRFSGHSFRRGGAQSLRDAGLPVDEIKVAGRWTSGAVMRYFSDAAAVATTLAPLFTQAVTASTTTMVAAPVAQLLPVGGLHSGSAAPDIHGPRDSAPATFRRWAAWPEGIMQPVRAPRTWFVPMAGYKRPAHVQLLPSMESLWCESDESESDARPTITASRRPRRSRVRL